MDPLYRCSVEPILTEIPGAPTRVWGGWVWTLFPSNTPQWSKAKTREECTRLVVAACEVHGAEALEDDE